MQFEQHEALRLADSKVVTEALGGKLWTCADSTINATLDITMTSWYIDLAGMRFWAFVSNGKLTSTSLKG